MTTDENTRFEAGLNKQVELFGADIAKRQTKGPVLRRNINRWLADNCFGDYYTRNGLNDQERELITFCSILVRAAVRTSCEGIQRETSAWAMTKKSCTALWSSVCLISAIPAA